MEAIGWARSDSTPVNKNIHPLAFWKKNPADVTSRQLLGLKMDHAANGNEKWHLLTHSFNNICRYCVMCVKWHLAEQNPINLSSSLHTFCSAESPVGAEGKMFCGCHGWLEEPLISLINSLIQGEHQQISPSSPAPKGKGGRTGSTGSEKRWRAQNLSQPGLNGRNWIFFSMTVLQQRAQVPKMKLQPCLPWLHFPAGRQCWHLAGILGLEEKKKKNGDVAPFLLLNLLQDTALVPWTSHQ